MFESLNLKGTVTVQNCDMTECEWIVANAYYGELWFYSSWDTEEEAIEHAKELGERAVVIKKEKN